MKPSIFRTHRSPSMKCNLMEMAVLQNLSSNSCTNQLLSKEPSAECAEQRSTNTLRMARMLDFTALIWTSAWSTLLANMTRSRDTWPSSMFKTIRDLSCKLDKGPSSEELWSSRRWRLKEALKVKMESKRNLPRLINLTQQSMKLSLRSWLWVLSQMNYLKHVLSHSWSISRITMRAAPIYSRPSLVDPRHSKSSLKIKKTKSTNPFQITQPSQLNPVTKSAQISCPSSLPQLPARTNPQQSRKSRITVAYLRINRRLILELPRNQIQSSKKLTNEREARLGKI